MDAFDDYAAAHPAAELLEPEPITRKDSWFRKLRDGRTEINLVGVAGEVPVKIRASLPDDDVTDVIEVFEYITGSTVEWEGRPSPTHGERPIPGQTTIMEQLESLDEG